MPAAKRKKAMDEDGCEKPKTTRKKVPRKGEMVYHVFLLGFSEEEAFSLKEGASAEVTFTEDLSSNVTHIVLSPTACSQTLPWIKLYLAIVSRVWLVRPSWLKDVKNNQKHAWGTNNLEIQYAPRETNGPGLLKLVKLYANYVKSENKPFAVPIFEKTVLLSGDDEELVRDIRSIIELGGGALASNDVEEQITFRPKMTKSMVSVAVFFPGYLPNQLTTQLLSSGVPVISHDVILQTVENTVSKSEKELLEKSLEHWKQHGFGLLKEKIETKRVTAKRNVGSVVEPPKFLGSIRLGKNSTNAFQSIGERPVACQPLDKLLENLKIGSKMLRQSVASQNNFKDTVAELQKLDVDEVREIKVFTALSMVKNSDLDNFLPAPFVVSFLLYRVVTNEDAREASLEICSLLRDLIQKFPPYSTDSRGYWRQVFTKFHGETAKSGRATTSAGEDWAQCLREILDSIVRSPSENVGLLDFVVHLFEAELYFLDKGQHGKLDGPMRLVPDEFRFHGVDVDLPMFYCLFYEVYDIRTMGINNKATEFLYKISAALGDAEKEKSRLLLMSLARLQTICLQSLNFVFTQRDRPLGEFEQDVKRILRRSIRQFPPKQLTKLFPGEWFSKLIRTIDDYQEKLAA